MHRWFLPLAMSAIFLFIVAAGGCMWGYEEDDD